VRFKVSARASNLHQMPWEHLHAEVHNYMKSAGWKPVGGHAAANWGVASGAITNRALHSMHSHLTSLGFDMGITFSGGLRWQHPNGSRFRVDWWDGLAHLSKP
jgi:hypothetical protein